MIITNITHGLGNQMFQYAVGRAVSIVRGVSLRLDISAFQNHGFHQGFELEQIFNCRAEIAGKEDIRGVLGWQQPLRIRRFLSRRKMAPLRCKGLVVEPHYHYWPEINNAPPDCYLVGYWQSEKYFQEHASVIRADFTFQTPLVNRNAGLAEQIAKVNAVSLHVRRGDYASNPKTLIKHGLSPLSYYEAAINYIARYVEEPHYFVFSDDIDWVLTNLKIKHPCCYVVHNRGSESYNDMRLISLCRHHIIANSSFSWWGAWLNPSTTKIVVAPKHWFNDYPVDISDLFTESWIAL